jgi:carbamoylphosphate synthase large subunit
MGVLDKFDVEMIGATAEAIDKAEDRELFREAMTKIGLDTPRRGSPTPPPEEGLDRDARGRTRARQARRRRRSTPRSSARAAMERSARRRPPQALQEHALARR